MSHRASILAALVTVAIAAPCVPRAAADDCIDEILATPVHPPLGWRAQQEAWEQRLPPGQRSGPDGEPGPDSDIGMLANWWADAAKWHRPPWPERTPTLAVRRRLLAACQRDPWRLGALLRYLPDEAPTYEWVKDHLDTSSRDVVEPARPAIREWLMQRSRHYRAELCAAAASARFERNAIVGQEAVEALARLDGVAAEPVLRAHTDGGEPRLRALALGLQLDRAVHDRALARAVALEAALRAIVADKTAPGLARALAFDAVFRRAAPDRPAWYVACVRDATLTDLSDGRHHWPLAMPAIRDPDRWLPLLAALVRDPDRAVRDSAVRCLFVFVPGHDAPRRADALRALLPWLDDPEWSSVDRGRSYLLDALARVDVPEALPALLRLAKSTSGRDLAEVALALARDPGPAATAAVRDALVRLGDEPTRAELFRLVFEEGSTRDRALLLVRCTVEANRREVIQALLERGGLDDDEAFAALVAHGREPPRADDTDTRILALDAQIGGLLVDRRGWSDALVDRLVAAAGELRARDPGVADRLQALADAAPGRRQDLATLRAIAEGTVTSARVTAALHRRAQLRECVGDELGALVRSSGVARGIAVALLDRAEASNAVLAGGDPDAQRALLACARIARQVLPVAPVADLVRSADPGLARAATVYLQDADGEEARAALIARPGAKVHLRGGRAIYPQLAFWEDRLLAEIESDPGLEETFALLSRGHWGHRGQIVIRVRGGRAVASHVDIAVPIAGGGVQMMTDGPLRWVRDVSATELLELRRFIREYEIDELAPLYTPVFHGIQYEYVHLTRLHGRSVFMNNPGNGGSAGTRPELLCERLESLVRGPGMALRFTVQEHVPGVEVLALGDRVVADGVAASGDDLCVRVRDSRALRAKWRQLVGGALGDERPRPEVIADAEWNADLPMGIHCEDRRFPWRSRAGDSCIRAGTFAGQRGLWRCRAGLAPELVAAGNWARPITTPDGAWAVAARETAPDRWIAVRVELATGACSSVELAPARHVDPLAYVPAHGKVLVRRSRPGPDETGAGPAEPEHYLIEVASGACERASGDFRPWRDDLGSRPLQPTGRANEVWVALADEGPRRTVIGRYDTRRFAFDPVATFPGIELSSMDVWVDREARFAHAVAYGRVLRLPLEAGPPR